MLFATSCEKGLDEVATVNETATVSFQVKTPEIATRAYSDGTTATQLQYAVYDENGNHLPMLNGTAKMEDLGAAVKLDLVTGNEYTVVFWADAWGNKEGAPYTFDAENHKVDIDYEGVESNDETLDAFYAHTTFKVNGAQNEVVELKRPFAQINVGTSDYTQALSAGVNVTKSKFIAKGVYKTLDLATDEVAGNAIDVTFDWADIAEDEENGFPVDGYEYMAMNYVLVPAAQQLVDVEFSYKGAKEYTRTVGSVPVQRNYRTNIFGKLITSQVDINITINPAYKTPSNDVEPWDGKTIEEPAATTETVNGKEVTTYTVTDGSELAWIAQYLIGNVTTTRAAAKGNFNITLTQDIDLGNNPWTPIGTSSNPYTGTFDGNNCWIKNLVVNGGDNNSNQGFFGYTTNGEIKNVTFENAQVSGRLNVGVVAGTPYTSKYSNITVKGLVEVEGMAYVGGVAGKNAYADWTNITVDVDEASYVKAHSIENGTAYRTYVGGVIGFNGEGGHSFTEITSNINVKGSTCDVGGLFGIAHYGNQFENCSCSGNVEIYAAEEGDAQEIGGIAGVWHNGGQDVVMNNCKFTGELSANVPFNEYAYGTNIVCSAYSKKEGKLIIDGVEYVENENGITIGGVLVISTAEQLKAFAAAVNDGNTFEGKTVKLINDIDLENKLWTTPIGNGETFNGTFDGNGKTISNLWTALNGEHYFVGLFGCLDNATIKDLTMTNVWISLYGEGTWGHIGAVAGWAEGNTTLENILVNGTVQITGEADNSGSQRIGGVVGGNQGGNVTFKNVKVEAAEGTAGYVRGFAHVGGIAGQLQGEASFEDCSSNLEVYAHQFFAGGIIGCAPQKCSFTNCEVAGSVSVVKGRSGNDNDLYRVGAIAGGWADGTKNPLVLTNCSYTCDLSGKSADGRTATAFDCGGFVGRGYATTVDAVVSVNGVEYKYAGNGVYHYVGAIVEVEGQKAVIFSMADGKTKAVSVAELNLKGKTLSDAQAWAAELGEGWSLTSIYDLDAIWTVRKALNNALKADNAENTLFCETDKMENDKYAMYLSSTVAEGADPQGEAYFANRVFVKYFNLTGYWDYPYSTFATINVAAPLKDNYFGRAVIEL